MKLIVQQLFYKINAVQEYLKPLRKTNPF